jgi:hypothetical protein
MIKKKKIKVAIHELMHVLVFHSELYADYVDGFGSTRTRPVGSVDRTITVRGRSAHAIVTPKVLSVAREYFACGKYYLQFIEPRVN